MKTENYHQRGETVIILVIHSRNAYFLVFERRDLPSRGDGGSFKHGHPLF